MFSPLRRWAGLLAAGGVAALGYAVARREPTPVPTAGKVAEVEVARALEAPLQRGGIPGEIEVLVDGLPQAARVTYTLDPFLQGYMERQMRLFGPDHGAFVALDAVTGRVLVLVSRSRKPSVVGNLALRSSFPVASLFKIITAAAVLDRDRADSESEIAFNGSDHTLYRRNVEQTRLTRWTRRMSLREAFARSVNTVFAKVGIFMLSPEDLAEYAGRFGFNRAISAGIPMEEGTVSIDGDRWRMAELASGFNRVALMSPLQGAVIAGTVSNDGVMMQPYLVDRLDSASGESLYDALPREASRAVTPRAAAELREMMRETVLRGTSRRSFRDLLVSRRARGWVFGGKTGSLSGEDPKGKCDWFVGFAHEPHGQGWTGRRVAVAALTVNEKNWRVKSSYLARLFFERMLIQTGE